MIPSLSEIESAIKIPAIEWSERCYEISCAIVKSGLIDGIAVYGHYDGEVAPNTPFFNRVFIRHGWIVTKDKRIIDPTRWVFEGVEPYIFEAKASHPDYDRGGEAFRLFFQDAFPTPIPKFNPESNVIIDLEEVDKLLFTALLGLDDVIDQVCAEQIFWLANRPLSTLSDMAKPLYLWLKAHNYTGFIPLDYRIMVMGK